MTRINLGIGIVGFWISAGAATAQPATNVAALAKEPAVQAALAAIRAGERQTVDEQVRFCEVPAPPFNETARGDVLRKAFADLGLSNVRVDRAGNVLAERPGATARPHLVVAAHLDTVFPPETKVAVRREGAVLHGPGISDNCRGLAVLTAIARAMRDARVVTPGTITFVANVGEEGLGDLRGVKALFGETLKGQVDQFVSIDGSGVNVTNVAVGSLRYRITFKGPGGHSFGAFGIANPAHALGRAVAKISEFKVPSRPLTTFNVGRIGGGTSVNAIPFEAWMEVDLRSSAPAALKALDAELQPRRRRSGGRGKPPVGQAGHGHGREDPGGRSAGRRAGRQRTDRSGGPRRRAGARLDRAPVRRVDGREPAAQPGDSVGHHRGRR